MAYSDINRVMTQADIDNILGRIDEINNVLNFLVNLTPAEKRSKLQLGEKVELFLNDCMSILDGFPELVPGTENLAAIKNDITLYRQLEHVQRKMAGLQHAIDNTIYAVRGESVDACLVIYKAAKSAAKRNNPKAQTACEVLNKYFERKPYKKRKVKTSKQ